MKVYNRNILARQELKPDSTNAEKTILLFSGSPGRVSLFENFIVKNNGSGTATVKFYLSTSPDTGTVSANDQIDELTFSSQEHKKLSSMVDRCVSSIEDTTQHLIVTYSDSLTIIGSGYEFVDEDFSSVSENSYNPNPPNYRELRNRYSDIALMTSEKVFNDHRLIYTADRDIMLTSLSAHNYDGSDRVIRLDLVPKGQIKDSHYLFRFTVPGGVDTLLYSTDVEGIILNQGDKLYTYAESTPTTREVEIDIMGKRIDGAS